MRREERDWVRLRGDEVGEELEGDGVEVEVLMLESTVGSFADQPSETNTYEKIMKQWNWRVGLRCERLSSLFCYLSLLLYKEYK
jgi:hypothetical protein